MNRELPSGWPVRIGAGGPPHPVRDPFTGGVIAHVPHATPDEVGHAVARAATYRPPPAAERAAILDRATAIVRDRLEDFARVIALEAGKPLAQARGEATRCLDTLTYSAIEARTMAGEMVPMEGTTAGAGTMGMLVREPVGVVAAITPFNFPLNLVAHKLGPAVAAGCPVVCKPAPQTPLSALGLADALLRAGLPPEGLHMLPGDAAVGEALVTHPDVALVSFTGGHRAGRAIQARLPHTPVLLELGNATPVIVADDADLADAARRVARSGFTHAGQSCVSVQRVYVHRAVHRAFLELLTAEVQTLVTGDPLAESTDVGPLIDADATARVNAWIDEAVAMGGTLVAGGVMRDGLLVPTVIDGLPPGCRIARDEVFGPVVGVAPIADLAEGVHLANATPLGLQAGIFTARVGDALALARSLHFGAVVINETPTFRSDQMPYGGVKHSGNTREGPREAVRAMTVPKLLVVRLSS